MERRAVSTVREVHGGKHGAQNVSAARHDSTVWHRQPRSPRTATT
jgi:hypothetical protein